MRQMDLAEQLKRDGMTAAAIGNAPALERLREIARRFGRRYQTCTVNDVRRQCAVHGISFEAAGNAAGSIFKEKCWEYIKHVRSTHPMGHGRMVALWRFMKEHDDGR